MPGDSLPAVLAALAASPAIDEAVLLSTCNRVEVYVIPTDTADAARTAIDEVLFAETGLPKGTITTHGYSVSGREGVHHLMRVASSLDSMVVGEPQILGQLKEAVGIARASNTVGPLLGRILERAFGVAKAVRTDTGIAREVVSVGSVAVDLACRIFDDLAASRVLVIGAGKMAEMTARSLTGAGVVRVYVANRSYDRAASLAARHGWRARNLDELEDLLGQVDVVISSTGASRPLITSSLVRSAVRVRKYRPLLIVDIAVPRDVEEAVGEIDTVYLYNVDDLDSISEANMAGRQREVEAAEDMVKGELVQVEGWFRTLAVKPTLSAIRARADTVARAEFERTWVKRFSHLGDEERAAMEKMVEAMVAKLLHPTMSALRDAASNGAGASLVSAARTLHGVEGEETDGDEVEGA